MTTITSAEKLYAFFLQQVAAESYIEVLDVDTDGNILGVLTAKGASGLAATSDDLQIAGDAGNIIDAGAGNDLVFGGTGSDVIDAGADNDIVIGLAGDDIIRGGSGNDKLHGDGSPGTFGAPSGLSATTAPDQHGNDDIDGGAGNDEIFGDGGIDTLLGGEGEDTIRGDSPLLAEAFHGDDFINGGANSCTGAASRVEGAEKAHQCLIYAESRRRTGKRAANQLQVANEESWSNAA